MTNTKPAGKYRSEPLLLYMAPKLTERERKNEMIMMRAKGMPLSPEEEAELAKAYLKTPKVPEVMTQLRAAELIVQTDIMSRKRRRIMGIPVDGWR